MREYKPTKEFITRLYKIGLDVKFWSSAINRISEEYEISSEEQYHLFSSICAVYDYNLESKSGNLKVLKNSQLEVTSKNIRSHKDEFLQWVINSSLLRAYNSIELLIYKCIALEYMDFEFRLEDGKGHGIIINQKIQECMKNNGLGKFSTNNNKHLIKYLEYKSPLLREFLKSKVRIDLSTTWKEFFDLLATLRHVIAHNDMMLNKDTINHIKSNGKELYQRYFTEKFNNQNLSPLSLKQDVYSNILNMTNEFGLNLAKFIKKEPNLKFAGFE